MLTIRFARTGKRNSAKFKIMLQEKTATPGGRHIEILGSYDPHLKKTTLKEERVKYWLSQGVHVSDTVHNLLVSNGLIEGKKRSVKLPQKPVPDAGASIEENTVKNQSVVEELKSEEKKEAKV